MKEDGLRLRSTDSNRAARLLIKGNRRVDGRIVMQEDAPFKAQGGQKRRERAAEVFDKRLFRRPQTEEVLLSLRLAQAAQYRQRNGTPPPLGIQPDVRVREGGKGAPAVCDRLKKGGAPQREGFPCALRVNLGAKMPYRSCKMRATKASLGTGLVV